ncbi:MAG: HAD-IA family hydrolase [Candidatus Jorgensenbacteria bacterium]
MNFKAIGFDYGGVIAGIPGPEFNKRVTDLLGVEPKTFQDVYFEFNHLMNNNILSWQDFWKKVTEELGVFDKYEDLIKFIEGLPRREINNQILDLADKLRVGGYKVGLLSNNDIAAAIRFRETGLTNHFDVVVVSAEIGYSKPHSKAFEIFIERLGVTAKDLIYIDDTEKSLTTAKEIGFYPILFTNYESLLHDLKSLGVKI